MLNEAQFMLERILDEKRVELIQKKENERVLNLDELKNIYFQLKKVIYNKYYPQIEKLYPWYTDHGQRHVESIIHMLGELLCQSYGRLNEMEIFILLCACIFHDTGMVKNRDNHADEVKNTIQEMGAFISDITVMRQINVIASAHSSKKKLIELKLKDSCTYNRLNYDVQTRALASMLRLADDISETRYRINPDLLDKVPEKNAIFWYYAYIVESVEILAADMKCKIKLSIPRSIILKEFYYEGNSDKIFFEYILERLEKSYRERIMCSLEFRNIVIISAFEIEMNIMTNDLLEEIDSLHFEINENYFQTLDLKDAFYKENPEWTIEELKKKYI